ncbi:hypothetical protein ASD74_02335 [Rhizobium sp. Root564]|nr:hypothetical protein ASD74_02335 [Rhizobium sp. Root564]
MITELGKELRKLRIENNERLVEMAAKVEKSAAFISAVEVGTKSPPSGFEELIIRAYGLATGAANALRVAADRSRNAFSLQPESMLGRDTAGLMARRMNTLSNEQLEQIRRILSNREEGNE